MTLNDGFAGLIRQAEAHLLCRWLVDGMDSETREDQRERAAVKAAADWRCERCDRQCRRPGEPLVSRREVLATARAENGPLQALCAPCQLRVHAPYYSRLRKKYRYLIRVERYGQLELVL